ncbi:MAG: hypothetical protein GXP08_14300 [Gammaproteobacteria bacterium]|nr:hypothetical protein [Gammaproteobacteria bacterium]
MNSIEINLLHRLLGEPRDKANCTLAALHDGVVTPWNRITIPRSYALSYTAANAHFTPSN